MDIRNDRGRALPPTVYLLAACLFAMGSSEFIISGVLAEIATDLDVSVGAAGGLISAFAIGVVLGAPPLAWLTLKWPPRSVLVGAQLLFAVALVLGLLGGAYATLFAGRFLSGVAYAAFWAVSAVAAVRTVSADRSARALSVVVAGLSIAMVVGGPLGTVVGNTWGWRWAFYGVAAAVVLLALTLRVTMRSTGMASAPSSRRAELRVFTRPKVWAAYAVTLTTTSMYMVCFSYVGAAISEVSPNSDVLVPVALLCFGVGAFLGLNVGGRYSDRHPLTVKIIAILITITVIILMMFAASDGLVLTILAFPLGFGGFLLNPAVMARVFTVAGDAPTFTAAVNVAAMQLGITLAPMVAGLVFTLGGHYPTAFGTGLLWGPLALGVLFIAERATRRATAVEET